MQTTLYCKVSKGRLPRFRFASCCALLLAAALVPRTIAAQSAAETDKCDRGGSLSAHGVGPVRIGMTFDSLSRACRLLDAGRFVPEHSSTVHAVRVGADTVSVWVQNGKIIWIEIDSPVHRTRDSLGVGTSVERLLAIPDIAGGPADGNREYVVYARSGELCGLAFWLDEKTSAAMAVVRGDFPRILAMRGGGGVVVRIDVRGPCR